MGSIASSRWAPFPNIPLIPFTKEKLERSDLITQFSPSPWVSTFRCVGKLKAQRSNVIYAVCPMQYNCGDALNLRKILNSKLVQHESSPHMRSSIEHKS